MPSEQVMSMLATGVLWGVSIFQLLLALGAPFGRAAWGGEHAVLPRRLRLGSLCAALVLILASWVVLRRSGVIGEQGNSAIHIATWAFAALFALNTLGNALSRSPSEKLVMTPVTLFLSAAVITVALS